MTDSHSLQPSPLRPWSLSPGPLWLLQGCCSAPLPCRWLPPRSDWCPSHSPSQCGRLPVPRLHQVGPLPHLLALPSGRHCLPAAPHLPACILHGHTLKALSAGRPSDELCLAAARAIHLLEVPERGPCNRSLPHAGVAEAWLRPAAEWSTLPAAVAPLTLEALQAPPTEPQAADRLRCSLILGATRVVQSALAVFGRVAAAAELLQPASAALASLLAESGLPRVSA